MKLWLRVAEGVYQRRLGLIHAHPDRAGKAAIAGEVTRESRGEQAGAGLDRLTPGEYARLRLADLAGA